MAENKERKFTTNAVVTRVGEKTVVSVLNAEVANVSGADGKIVMFKRDDEAERNANLGKKPELRKITMKRNGEDVERDVCSCNIVLVNDTKSINYGDRKLEVSTDKKGNERIYLTVEAYGPAAQDLARVAEVGGHISLLNAELVVNEAENGKQYGRLRIGNYKQAGTARYARGNNASTTEEETTPTAQKTETPDVPEVPENEDPFANFFE